MFWHFQGVWNKSIDLKWVKTSVIFDILDLRLCRRVVNCTSGKLSLHFIYIFRTNWNVLIKFWDWSMFHIETMAPLNIKYETSAYANCDYSYFIILQISWNNMKSKLALGILLVIEVALWFHHLGHVPFSKTYSRSVNCTLPYQIYYIETLT